MGQVIFHSTNELMPHQFVQNKFVQEFVAVSLLIYGEGRERERPDISSFLYFPKVLCRGSLRKCSK